MVRLAQWLAHLPLVLEVPGSIPALRCSNTISLVPFAGMTLHLPLDLDDNWMSPVHGKVPLVQDKEP